MKRTLIIIFIIFSVTLSAQTIARWYTSMGDFEIKMREDLVPITVQNFVDLTNTHFYDGLIFHRVIADFMIQDGCPYGTGYGGPGYTIEDEFHEDILFNEPGVIGMANTGSPNTAGSQYFITVAPYTSLNYSYAAFGNVIEGYDIVENISEVPTTGPDGSPANKPLEDVVIDSVRIMTPQLSGYAPEELTLNQMVGDTQVFVLFSQESDLTFSWFINDVIQSETSSIFVYIFPEVGSFTFRGEASNGDYSYPVEWCVEVSSTDAEDNSVPDAISLLQNYPNPFSINNNRGISTRIPFSIKQKSYISLDVYNLKGQHIVNIFNGIMDAGTHTIGWDGLDAFGMPLESGIYLYRIKSKGKEDTKKIVIIK